MPWPGTVHPRSPTRTDTCPRNGLAPTRRTPPTSSGGCWRRWYRSAVRVLAWAAGRCATPGGTWWTRSGTWRTGCQWDALPVDFPPAPLVKHYFTVWTRDGTLTRLHNTLREQVRQVEARNATPTAAIIDSQSVKAAENVWRSSRGYD